VEGFNVLFVDDEVDFLETLLKRMKKRQLNAFGVNSGEDALAYLKDHAVDVVVMDVRMPGMDGIETLRKIKKTNPLLEVIMLTGHACLEIAREGMEVGAFDYLMKPCDVDQLVSKAEAASLRRRSHEEKIIQARMKEITSR
jgi:DNA-binding NtrC family response regulator